MAPITIGSGVRQRGNETPFDAITVTATAEDDDGSVSTSDSGDLIVNNVDPVFKWGPYIEFEYDASGTPLYATVFGEIEDRGEGDKHKLYVEWGDGVLGDGVPPDYSHPTLVDAGEFSFSRDLIASPMVSEDAVLPVTVRVDDDDLGMAVAMLQNPRPHIKFDGEITVKETIPVRPVNVDGMKYIGDGAAFKAEVEKYIKQQLLDGKGNPNDWAVIFGPDIPEVDPAGSVLGYSGIVIAHKIVVDAQSKGHTLDFRGTELILRPYAVVVDDDYTTDAISNWIRITPDGDPDPEKVNAQMSVLTHEMWHTEGVSPEWLAGVKTGNKIQLQVREGYLRGARLAKEQAETAFDTYLDGFPPGAALPTEAQAVAQAETIFNTHFRNIGARQAILQHGFWHATNDDPNYAQYVWNGTRQRL